MKKTHMIWASIALVSALMTGCGGQSAQPVAINESVDKCDICNMQIADDHNATEIILKDGKALKFDDIGDLFAWIKKNGTEKIDVKFVRDYHTKEWMNLNDASKTEGHSTQQHDAGKAEGHTTQQHDAGKSAGEHNGSTPSTETPASGAGH